MKTLSIFKKEKKSSVKAQAQTLNKKQLEKVMGGLESVTQTETTETTSGQKAKAWMVNN